jgi:hypothetical protein
MNEMAIFCQDCGVSSEVDTTVGDTTCPFASEIHNEEVEIVVCDKCYQQRLYDI